MFKLFGKREKPIDYIVAGLGNPGMKYQDTRHNAGFMAIDLLAEKYNLTIKRMRFKALTAEGVINGKKVFLMKPQTFMNLSGEAVIQAMRFYKLPPERVLVMFDDIMLDVGRIRVKRKGTDGGQKGMRSIIDLTGSEDFPRVKIGIGKKPHPDYDLASWVTSKFTKKETAQLKSALDNAVSAAELVIEDDIDEAMSRFNG